VVSRGLRAVEPDGLGVFHGDSECIPLGASLGWLEAGEETTSSKWMAGISKA